MLTDLDETLKQLLIKNIPIKNNEVDIQFDLPKRDWSAGLSRPTINLYLYDICENTKLRRNEWIVERGENGQATKKKPPKRINVSYMVTVWANAIEDEHRYGVRSTTSLKLPFTSPSSCRWTSPKPSPGRWCSPSAFVWNRVSHARGLSRRLSKPQILRAMRTINLITDVYWAQLDFVKKGAR